MVTEGNVRTLLVNDFWVFCMVEVNPILNFMAEMLY